MCLPPYMQVKEKMSSSVKMIPWGEMINKLVYGSKVKSTISIVNVIFDRFTNLKECGRTPQTHIDFGFLLDHNSATSVYIRPLAKYCLGIYALHKSVS